ncbi:TIGR03857 family LLM class F420-dependent oxidoreductase [Aquihabitans daechungensis]|uniref:TIGR03857 family LLM class F420-dependent oxidoreductase n=1 Tax=Aquihabitans daechungensis TaxID=1052257 RepID=UPI003BA022CC
MTDALPLHDPLPELGFYGLAGGPTTPAPLLEEVRLGEELGFGTCFLSERFNVKEAATLCGAAGAVSSRLRIATAATNHNTRHPLVTASMATTMHRLTDGRFTLGLGRGIAALQGAYGLEPITTAQLEDMADVLRRLWHGEAIFSHDGPIGSYPVLHLDSSFDEDIPLLLVAFGPNSLRLAGRAFDEVVLHTFFTDDTTADAVATVRRAAEEAGRDPAEVKVWSCFATVPDTLDEGVRLKRTVGRLATYLQGYGDLLVRTNGWDPEVLARFRADPLVAAFPGAIDVLATTEELEHFAELLPEMWLAASAMGSPRECAVAIEAQFALGVDGVILHGSPPEDLAPILPAYRALVSA